MEFHATLSEGLSPPVIPLTEIAAAAPGTSAADGVAAAIRGLREPFAIIARPGWGLLVDERVREGLLQVMTARPALTAVAIAYAGDAPTPVLGAALTPDDTATRRLPIAVALDVRRSALAARALGVASGDPWIDLVERIRLSGALLEWRAIFGQTPADLVATTNDSLPPMNGSLDLGDVGVRPLPDDPATILGPGWTSVWVPEADDHHQPISGPHRPDVSWRRLAYVRADEAPGAQPVQLDDASPVLGWVMPDGLPGGVPLMVFHTPDGRPVLAEADSAVPPGESARMLGWGLAAPTAAVAPARVVPADCIEVDGVTLYRGRRPGTRGLFMDPADTGQLTAAPLPGSVPIGYAATRPGPGLVPIVHEGIVIGYGVGQSTSGSVAWMGDPPAEYRAADRSLLARVRRRAAVEVRTRRACPDVGVLVLPWLTTGGADSFVTALTESLRARGMRMHVVLTYPGAESPGDRRELIRPFAASLMCAPEDAPGRPLPNVIMEVARRERAGHLIICGGWQSYEGLPGLRAALPGVRVTDILFNDIGHVGNNRRLAPWIDMTVCAYDGLRTLLVEGYGEDPSRVTTAYIGIDTDRFRPATADARASLKRQMGFDPARPLWGYAGRVSEEKCLPDLVEAVAMVKDELDVQVVIQGEGPASDHVRRAVATSGLDVVVRPFQPDQLPMLQALDAYVLPSRVEGIPLALMEAAACGAMPVATAVGGVPDLVRPGQTGYLAAPRDPSSLAAALLAARDTPPWLRDEMAHEARELVRTSMSWDGTVDAYAAILGLTR